MNANEILTLMKIGEKTRQANIIRYFAKHKKITTWDCIRSFHYSRLSALIFNMKKAGVKITDEWEVSEKGRRYKVYYLGEKKDD